MLIALMWVAIGMTALMMRALVLIALMRDLVLIALMTLHHEKTATSDEESDEDSMAETRLSREKTTSDSASSPLLSGPERRRGEEMQDVALDLEVPKQSLKPCLEEIWL